MKLLDKAIKNHKYLVFLDFEGTQYSHEMIAIGAVLATLDRKGQIKRLKKGYKAYVLAKNKIGTFVENLTGITQPLLDSKGVSFPQALKGLREYCGSAYTHCTFVTFGNHDMKILNESYAHNLDTPKDLVQQIQHNYLDFSAFISNFVKDSHGNPYSLSNYCAHFYLNREGIEHDPLYDAINLAKLYDGFVRSPELVLEDYLVTLSKMPHLPVPIKTVIDRLSKGETVTADDYKEIAKEYLK